MASGCDPAAGACRAAAGVVDGPLPIGDLVGLGILTGALIYDACTDDDNTEFCERRLEAELKTCRALGRRERADI